jgi:hypothetical protein
VFLSNDVLTALTGGTVAAEAAVTVAGVAPLTAVLVFATAGDGGEGNSELAFVLVLTSTP